MDSTNKTNTRQENQPEIRLVKDPEALARTALEIFMEWAGRSINGSGSFNVALSGGHTPERFFHLLAEEPEAAKIQWKKVQIFWVDERCVPPSAEASNYGLAAHTFLNKISIPEENIHRVVAETNDCSRSVKAYEETIRRVFNVKPGEIPIFDLVVLGMGADGHIGSLFPNSYAHFDTEDLVTTVYVMGGYNRITLTYPVIRAARHLMVLVSGAEKADIVREVLLGEPDEVKYPVHILWPSLDKITWVIDETAGRHLK